MEEEVSQGNSILGWGEQMTSRWPPGQPDSHAAGIAFLEVESSSQKNFFQTKMSQMWIPGLSPLEEGEG